MPHDGSNGVIEGFGFEEETAHSSQNTSSGFTSSSKAKVPNDNVDWSQRLPWPKDFPNFRGVLFFKMDDRDYGKGMMSQGVELYNLEYHPDQTNYAHIARMRLKGTQLSVPPDAHEMYQDHVGNVFVWEVIYAIDKNKKLMCRIGANSVDAETDKNFIGGFGIESQPKESAGVWNWHKIPPNISGEGELNDSNTFISEVNFAGKIYAKDPENWDPTDSMLFYIEDQSQETSVCPQLHPPSEGRVAGQIKELERYFGSPDDVGFRSTIETDKWTITTSVKVLSIGQIDTLKERFHGVVEITMTWPITKPDAVSYAVHSDRVKWTPEFTTPTFKVTNSDGDNETSKKMIEISPVRLVEIDGKFMAQQKMHVDGDFYSPFDLESYPFDVQRLTIQISTDPDLEDNFEFVCECSDPVPTFRDTEWHGTGLEAEHTFIQTGGVGSNKRGMHQIDMRVAAGRYYTVHMWRIVSVMALFSLSSVLGLINDPDVASVDRLAFVFTLMLTATAYSLVIAQNLPSLGYLTMLDKYILGTFGFIFAVAVEIACIFWYDNGFFSSKEEPAPDAPSFDVVSITAYCSLADVGIWIIAHIVMTVYVKTSVIPKELKKH